MLFSQLAQYLEKLEKTSSRLEITAILRQLFENTSEQEIDKVVYLSLGVLAPNYEGVILNLAEKMMIKAMGLAYNINSQKVLEKYKKLGDLGNVAENLSPFTDHLRLPDGQGSLITVNDVYQNLLNIAKTSGEGSTDQKITTMANLLKNLDSLSARFVARIPVGRLRLGFSEKTVLDALGVNESTYNIRPDIGYIAKLAKSKKLNTVSPKLGVPVVPMLAARLNSPTEMIKKMGEVSVEPKFDGLRIFIHYQKPSFLKIFTRNMNYLDENIFPELKDIGQYIKADNVILDTEAVGLDPKRQFFVDFQTTMNRRRKHNIDKSTSDTPLQFQVFDILFVDDKSLLQEPYRARRQMLKSQITNSKLLRVDENTITKDPEVIRRLHQKYLKMGLEGVIVKKVDGKYISGRTGWNWVKMKEVEGARGKLVDTVDLVIMGYTQGKGKRVGFGVGQFLAGVKDKDNFKTVTKVGTGLTDEQFRDLRKRLEKAKTKDKPKEYEVHKDLTPDYWVYPQIVVELAADEITVSPKHTARFALRFPRLVKFRDDKSFSQITTFDELKNLWKLSH